MEGKTPNYMLIKAINNANKNPQQLQNWIIEVSDLHKEKISSLANYTKKMPNIESLMQVYIKLYKIWSDNMK
jgi:hypothetical protein